jgi:inorganic pyrophosphatase
MKQTPMSDLEAFDEKKGEWRVVIETPKESHNKYKFDEELALFTLHDVLPEGMSFPYDFGFLPSTVGDDGDPLDILLLMDYPAFCGCIVPSRLIGVIEAEQMEVDGKAVRNDRLVAVPTKCRAYSDCTNIKDLNADRVKQIEEFFVSYNRIQGKKFKVLNVSGPKKAQELAQEGMKKRAKSKK